MGSQVPRARGEPEALLRVIPQASDGATRGRPAIACSLFAFLYGATAHAPRLERIGRGVAESLSKDLAHGLEVASEDPARVRVVRYEDLVSAPVETLAGIHAGFEIPFSPDLERAARTWLAANPQGRHGTHTYDLATYGLDEETVEATLRDPEEILRRIG